MKRLLGCLLLLMGSGTCWGEMSITRPYPTLQELDGSPSVRYPLIKVNNGSLTDNTTFATLSLGVTSLTGTTNRVTVSATSGDVTLSGPQDIATTSTPTFSGAIFSGVPGSDSYGVTRGWTASRGQNLVTNGSGLLGNNYNFRYDYNGNSAFTFDPIETHGGGGSFKANQAYGIFVTEEFIPVDTQKNYRMVAWGKSGEAGGTNYNAANVQYVGLITYDIDLLQIDPYYYAKNSGSTDTTLAKALVVGNTTMTLTSTVGWANAGVNTSDQMSWWPYTNSKGYSYPNYTYTRNVSAYTSGNIYYTDGLWAAGGIVGNVVTLTHPWNGATLPAGTPVRNAVDGGTFKYITVLGLAVPNDWTRYEGYIGGIDTAGAQVINQFPYGTAFIKPLWLINYHGLADNNIRWSDIWFSELSANNLEIASSTNTGVVIVGVQTLGGQKTIKAVSSSDVPLTLQGAASQSGNLEEWKNSSAVVLASVTASGVFTGNGSGLTTLQSVGAFSGAIFVGLTSGTTFQAFVPTKAITMKNITFTADVASAGGSGDTFVCSDSLGNKVSVISANAAAAGTVTTSATTSVNISAGTTVYMRMDSGAVTKPQGNTVCTYIMQ